MSTFNLKNAVSDFELIPAGEYRVVLESIERVVSRAGNDMFKGTFVIIDGDFVKRKLFNNFVMTEKALFNTANYLTACGIKKLGDSMTVEEVGELIKQTMSVPVKIDLIIQDSFNNIKKFYSDKTFDTSKVDNSIFKEDVL